MPETNFDNIRTKSVHHLGLTVTVAEGDSSLVMNEDGSYLSDEARYWDESIYAFVPTEVFEQEAVSIAKYMRENGI